ncbi:1-acyl-sn-glycerol-3-phosphate acyltransferase [Polluticaenibacter yanchengensis]|uniref:1-acyl-sn-glycerol-3-phosphate acyltransferase n=1 Tax=Polluticaenibacter yanchengensis TaxID=3014562 RepID=A0ABT4UL04_9BACT|nr:1-acyl-sn-glycerol-3-phosphate acyltransferase [Chitinophagaceae bacterium LY-5]
MLYFIVKIWVNIALPLFTKKIRIFNKEHLKVTGPTVLAVNHPNALFDAMLVGSQMQQGTWFITRGDVFKNPKIRSILHQLKMIPMYRIRDGKDKLFLNDESQEKSIEVLKSNETLLIFVEGLCENQKELLLPLKKGGPRIMQSCWNDNVDVKVIPVWLEYSSYKTFGKTIDIRFGQPFDKTIQDSSASAAAGINAINAETTKQLLELSDNKAYDYKPLKTTMAAKVLLAVPALLGAVLHAPLYLPLQSFAKKKTAGSVFYDSILFALLLILYPIYLIIFCGVLTGITDWYGAWWGMIVLPVLAKCYVMWK